MKTETKKKLWLSLAMIALIVIGAGAFVLIGVKASQVATKELEKYEPSPSATPASQKLSFAALRTESLNPSQIEPFLTGIDGLHGLGFNNGTLYVSSWEEQKLYKVDVATKQRKLLADELDGVHDMVFPGDGTLVTPLFNDGRVVRVNTTTGQVKTLAKGLEGPNGIARARDGGFYISNAKGGTVTKLNKDGATTTIAKDLKEPAGIISDTDNILYIAQFADPSQSVIQLLDNGQIRPLVGGLTNAETLLRDDERNVIIGHVVDGKAAMSFFPRGGTEARTILVTNLPGPMVGPVTDGTYLYFESAGDSTVYRVPLPK